MIRVPTRTIALLLFGSGFAALIYQTAWQRMLRLVFGASSAASSAVLGIFLGGLGLGGFLLGRRAERSERPLLLYGNFELGVALTAALTPVLVDVCGWLYFRVGGSRSLGPYGATCLRLLLATMVLGPSVVLMGGTLPAAARAAETDEDAGRGRLALLYAVNTAGAVAGALLGTFILFEVLGTRLSLWAAAIINLLVAIVARAVGRNVAPIEGASFRQARSQAALESGPGPSAVPWSGNGALPAWAIYLVAGTVGFAFLYLELVWYRMLSPLLGGSSFTFGLVLALALSGIGIGSYLYTLRDPARPAEPWTLAVSIGFEAIAVGFPLALGDDVAIYAAYTRHLAGLGFPALVASWATVTALVVLPAAIVSGYQFPLLFALLGRGRTGVARHVGMAYAFNTVGSILGAIIGGFVLLPGWGAVASWRFVTWLLGALAVTTAVAALFWPKPIESSRQAAFREYRVVRGAITATVAAVLAALCTRAEGPTAVWRHSAIGAGRGPSKSMNRNELRLWKSQVLQNVRWERDGIESALALDTTNGYSFLVNGKSDGNVIGDRGTQTMMALLPAILHPAPRSVFVLGLGTGMSAGWVAEVPSVESVDVAEIEPLVAEIARRAELANFRVLDHPKVHLFRGDGREFLLTTDKRYDIIASEPSNPFRSGIASLFTREFYETVERHLTETGIFAQWLQGYEVDAYTVRMTLATLQSVFPAVEAWQTESSDFLLLATRKPLVHDIARLRRRVSEAPYQSALGRAWFVEDVEGIFAHFVAPAELIRRVAALHSGDLNTDDQNLLEFAFARNVGSSGYEGPVDLLQLAVASGLDRPRMTEPLDWNRVEEQQNRNWLTSNHQPPPLAAKDPNVRRRMDTVVAGCFSDYARAARSWEGQPAREPRDALETFVIAQMLAYNRDEKALSLGRRLADTGFVAEWELVQAIHQARTGHPSEAVDAALRGLAHLRRVALPLCNTAKLTIDLLAQVGERDKALARRAAEGLLIGPLAVALAERQRLDAARALAFQVDDASLALRALGDDIDVPRWSPSVLFHRHKYLKAANDPRAKAAEQDLEAYANATAGSLQDQFGSTTTETATPASSRP